jgi:hypothetical protein
MKQVTSYDESAARLATNDIRGLHRLSAQTSSTTWTGRPISRLFVTRRNCPAGWTRPKAVQPVGRKLWQTCREPDLCPKHHWIETASNHNRAEIKKLVQEHLAGSVAQKRGKSTAVPVKTFKFHLHDERQVEAVQAAIDRAKEIAGAPHDSAALEVICRDYMDRGMTMSPGPRAAAFVADLNHLPKITAAAVIRRVRADGIHDLNWQAD